MNVSLCTRKDCIASSSPIPREPLMYLKLSPRELGSESDVSSNRPNAKRLPRAQTNTPSSLPTLQSPKSLNQNTSPNVYKHHGIPHPLRAPQRRPRPSHRPQQQRRRSPTLVPDLATDARNRHRRRARSQACGSFQGNVSVYICLSLLTMRRD
jgi:hypothetical protein